MYTCFTESCFSRLLWRDHVRRREWHAAAQGRTSWTSAAPGETAFSATRVYDRKLEFFL